MPRSVRIDRPQPTWKSGFARSAGESAYPNLWKGLIGAWSMGLGPTGGTLRDVSGFSNHGTLVNFEIGDDWIVDDGRYTLDFDGVSGFGDQVDLGNINNLGAGDWTVSIWFKTITAVSRNLVGKATEGSLVVWWDFTIGLITTGKIFVEFDDDNTKRQMESNDALNDNIWHLCTITRSAAGIFMYIDGVKQADSDSANTGTLSNAHDLVIGGETRTATDIEWLGQLDDFFQWNRGLTPNEACDLYTLGRGAIFQRRSLTIAKAPAVTANDWYYRQQQAVTA